MPETIVQLDPAELAVRMAEAQTGCRRPRDDPNETLAVMNDEITAAWLRASQAAIGYVIEMIAKAQGKLAN